MSGGYDTIGNQPAGAGIFTTLTTSSSAAIGGDMSLTSTDAGAGVGPTLTLIRNSASPASADLLGAVSWSGTNTSASLVQCAFIEPQLVNPVAGAEQTTLNFGTRNAGSVGTTMTLGAGLQVGAPTGGDQGSGTVNATGLYVNGVALNPVSPSTAVPVRQTVLSGPVDSNGLPSFGGSTGSTTLTVAGTLIATAANGFNSAGAINRVGSITNPSWTSLSTNGTMYVYLDIASDGTCTTGSTTLVPTYQWGGTYSTTNGQFTFNIQEMVGKVGNGSAANQTYRVFVGEVTVAANVVSAITWYALQGRYQAPFTTTLPGVSTATTLSHNIGSAPLGSPLLLLKNVSTEGGYSAGDIITQTVTVSSAGVLPYTFFISAKTFQFMTGEQVANQAVPKTGGTRFTLTPAKWSYSVVVLRGW